METGAAVPGSNDNRSIPTTTSSGTGIYSRGARVLHWSIAVLLLPLILLGIYGASGSDDDVLAQTATDVHKALGITVLVLMVVRIGWRFTHRPPALPGSMGRTYRRLIGVSHVLLYVFLLVMPLSGWWMSSAVPVRHPFGFGLFDVPFLPIAQSWPSAGIAHFLHVNLAWLVITLIVLHIGGVLKHRFVDRDEILQRMLPVRSRIDRHSS